MESPKCPDSSLPSKREDTKGECAFIGCGATAKFLFEKIDLAADRGYGVIVEPVGGENNRAYNLYQVTPTKVKAAPDMEKALKAIVERHEQGLALGEKLELELAREALAKARGE